MAGFQVSKDSKLAISVCCHAKPGDLLDEMSVLVPCHASCNLSLSGAWFLGSCRLFVFLLFSVVLASECDVTPVICSYVGLTGKRFGFTINSKGYKELPPYVRLIQVRALCPLEPSHPYC